MMNEKRERILIVGKSLDIGGVESAMVNLANALSKDYEVDILAYNSDGPMRERLLSTVNVLKPAWTILAVGTPLSRILSTKSFRKILFRIFCVLSSRMKDNTLCLKLAFQAQPTLSGYDLAIAFHHEVWKNAVVSGFSRFIEACVEAKMKVAWIHYDPLALNIDNAFNEQFYQDMDKIICVSRSVMEAAGEAFPILSGKMDYMYNIVDSAELIRKSEEIPDHVIPNNGTLFFSACRLAEEKGIGRAIDALAEIFTGHPDVYWFIAGEGPERNRIEALIRKYGLTRQIILLGNQPNPYPYFKRCDVYLNLSYHEAAPMVFTEAMILHTPVLATETRSAVEMLQGSKANIVCPNSEEGIRTAVESLIFDNNKVKELKKDADFQAGQYTGSEIYETIRRKNMIHNH